MYRLFYVSTANLGMSDAEVDAIARTATVKNEKIGVTGALAFNGVNFAQVIEGERSVIDTLMNEIRADGRHTGVIVVDQKEVGSRAYTNWSMKRIQGLSFNELMSCMAD